MTFLSFLKINNIQRAEFEKVMKKYINVAFPGGKGAELVFTS
jgi:hypothetical protein